MFKAIETPQDLLGVRLMLQVEAANFSGRVTRANHLFQAHNAVS